MDVSPVAETRRWMLFLLTRLALSVITLGAVGQAGAQQGSQPLTLKLATSAAPSQAIAKAWTYLADRIKQKTGGKVVVQVYFSSSLFGERTAIEAALNGAVDIGTSGVSQFAPWTDAFLPFDLPFLFTSISAARKVVDGPIGDQMRARAEQQAGLKIISIVDNGGGRPIFTTKKKVRTPSDLKGLKIRTVASPVDQTLFQCWGAIPTPMDFAEVYGALQQGVVEGEAPTYTFANGAKHYDVLKYSVEVAYVIPPGAAAMSVARFNALPPDIQKAILEAGKETEKFASVTDAADVKASRDAAIAKKIDIHVPNEAEMAEWRKCAIPVYKSYENKLPPGLIEQIRAAQR